MSQSPRATEPSEREPVLEQDTASFDLVDVPAAVVCAVCGLPDCSGCTTENAETTNVSGLVAIVPWERPGMPLHQRLWYTARLSTLSCESFFGSLPSGDVAPALRFAVLCELLAIIGLCLCTAVPVLLLAPELASLLLRNTDLVQRVARGATVAIPALAVIMVALHTLYGWALDRSAKRFSNKRGRGVRFGLYSCGWDLMTLPLGLALLAILSGPREALRALPLGWRAPRKAALSYLGGVHQLSNTQAHAALRSAGRLAVVIATSSASVLALGAVLATWLF